MPKITLCDGLILKNTDKKYGHKGCGGVDKIAEIALQFSIFSLFFKAPKLIPGNLSEMKSYVHNFQSDS